MYPGPAAVACSGGGIQRTLPSAGLEDTRDIAVVSGCLYVDTGVVSGAAGRPSAKSAEEIIANLCDRAALIHVAYHREIDCPGADAASRSQGQSNAGITTVADHFLGIIAGQPGPGIRVAIRGQCSVI